MYFVTAMLHKLVFIKNIDMSINIDTEIFERYHILISQSIDTPILAELSLHFSPKARWQTVLCSACHVSRLIRSGK